MLPRRLPRPQSLGPAWLLPKSQRSQRSQPFSSSADDDDAPRRPAPSRFPSLSPKSTWKPTLQDPSRPRPSSPPPPPAAAPPPSLKLPPRAGPPPSQLSRLKAHLSRLQIADNLPPSGPDEPSIIGRWRSDAPSEGQGRSQARLREHKLYQHKWASPHDAEAGAHFPDEDEVAWVKKVRQAADKAKLQANHLSVDSATVFLLKDLSKSLVPSDLYRIGQQQGKHIGGWSSGLVDALPRLDPATLEPLGQWLLHFDSPASAELWSDNATRRRRLAFDLHRPARSARIISDPQAYADARSFSLTAPDTRPIVPSKGSSRPYVMSAFARAVALRQLLRGALRSDSMVVVSLEGDGCGENTAAEEVGSCALTSAQLRVLVQDDAAEAGYEWEIVRMRQWGRPVRKKQQQHTRDHPIRTELADTPGLRFVVSFTDDDDAHRFRRWWHRKRVHLTGDHDPERTGPYVMTFNVHKI